MCLCNVVIPYAYAQMSAMVIEAQNLGIVNVWVAEFERKSRQRVFRLDASARGRDGA